MWHTPEILVIGDVKKGRIILKGVKSGKVRIFLLDTPSSLYKNTNDKRLFMDTFIKAKRQNNFLEIHQSKKTEK